jgi:hypothetical protein
MSWTITHLVTSRNARVLDSAGRPIEGLYVAEMTRRTSWAGISLNTVYLSLKDEWLTFDAWRVSVTGVFDRVDGHLAFDDSGVGSVGAGGEQFVEDLDGDALAGVGESVRGKNPGGWRWFAERPGGSG